MANLLDETSMAMTPADSGRQRRSPIPWILFVAIMLLVDGMILPLSRWMQIWGVGQVAADHAILMGMGCLSAQACLMAVLGGLYGRSWLSGYLIATCLSITGITMLMGGELLSTFYLYAIQSDWKVFVLPSLTVPMVVLAISVPTLILRTFYGWRLTRDRCQLVRPAHLGIEELFIGTAITAAALMLLRASQELGQIPSNQFWMPVALVCGVLAIASLVIVVPTVWVAFRVKGAGRRCLLYAGLATAASLLVITAIVIAEMIMERSGTLGSTNSFEAAYYATCWMIAASTTFVLGLTLLRVSGFALTRKPSNSASIELSRQAAKLDEIDGTECRATLCSELTRPSAEIDAVSKHHRRLAVATFAVALAANLGITSFLAVRTNRDEQLQQLHRSLSQRGGYLELDGEQRVIGMALGKAATPKDLLEATRFHELRTLSLADSQCTDGSLALLDAFPRLRRLDLSGTQITDAGLETITGLHQLEELSLADTRVTIEGIVDLMNSREIMKLDLSQLGLDDADLKQFATIRKSPYHPLFSIVLRKNPISSQGVSGLLLAQSQLSELDLTDCDVDEQVFGQGVNRSFKELRLDGSRISDGAFSLLLPKLNVSRLSIGRTSITDAILPALAASTSVTGLELGETQITEEGLAHCGIQQLERLCLNSPKFDGSCFATWTPKGLQTLDMSHSGVTDQSISAIVKLTSLIQIDLSHTGITDAALPILSKSSASEIDLSATQITVQGLLNSQFFNHTICLGLDQFSVSEFKQIRKKLRIYTVVEMHRR